VLLHHTSQKHSISKVKEQKSSEDADKPAEVGLLLKIAGHYATCVQPLHLSLSDLTHDTSLQQKMQQNMIKHKRLSVHTCELECQYNGGSVFQGSLA